MSSEDRAKHCLKMKGLYINLGKTNSFLCIFQTMKEEVDSDPQMARAAVYYLLILEDQLVSRVSQYIFGHECTRVYA